MRWIEKCLSNIQESSVNCSILIIDNNSTDGTPQFIKKYYPECVIIENSDNIGALPPQTGPVLELVL